MGFSVCPEDVENRFLLRLVCAGDKGKQNYVPLGFSSPVSYVLVYV